MTKSHSVAGRRGTRGSNENTCSPEHYIKHNSNTYDPKFLLTCTYMYLGHATVSIYCDMYDNTCALSAGKL